MRRCIGASFAQFEMRVIIRTILERAELRAVSARSERSKLRNVTAAPAHGCRVVLERMLSRQAAVNHGRPSGDCRAHALAPRWRSRCAPNSLAIFDLLTGGESPFDDFGPRAVESAPRPPGLDGNGGLAVIVDGEVAGDVSWNWEQWGPNAALALPQHRDLAAACVPRAQATAGRRRRNWSICSSAYTHQPRRGAHRRRERRRTAGAGVRPVFSGKESSGALSGATGHTATAFSTPVLRHDPRPAGT